MEVKEIMDIRGNVLPGALIECKSYDTATDHEWFLANIFPITNDVDKGNGTYKTISYQAGTTLNIRNPDDADILRIKNYYDIGLKVDIIGDNKWHLLDAVKFNGLYLSTYYQVNNNFDGTLACALTTYEPKEDVVPDRVIGTQDTSFRNKTASIVLLTTVLDDVYYTNPLKIVIKSDDTHYYLKNDLIFQINDESIENVFGGYGDIRVYDTDYGEYSETGGYGGGSFDDSSDSFGLPSLPSLGVSEVGFINVYNPTKGQLQGFADELFPNFEMPTASTKEGLEAISENIANTFTVLGDFAESYVNAGLVNYVIDCHIVPVAPRTNGTSNIKVGFKTFNYSPAKVTSDYVSFDCGSLEIAEYYQNFLDYEGTKAKLYLPFIGFVDIKPEWFQSGKLGVTYHFNIIDGSCIAFVIATSSKSKLRDTVVATFGGNCCVHMPITGVNYSSMISGVVGGAVGIASNASNMIKTNRADKGTVMSNIEGATGIASNLADAVGAKPSIEQSNGYNAGMSFMCYRRPYLLIERPVASFSKNYPREQGLPLNVTKKLGSMKGFTTCTAPVVDNFHCLEEEKEMIKQALIEGTIF